MEVWTLGSRTELDQTETVGSWEVMACEANASLHRNSKRRSCDRRRAFEESSSTAVAQVVKENDLTAGTV